MNKRKYFLTLIEIQKMKQIFIMIKPSFRRSSLTINRKILLSIFSKIKKVMKKNNLFINHLLGDPVNEWIEILLASSEKEYYFVLFVNHLLEDLVNE